MAIRFWTGVGPRLFAAVWLAYLCCPPVLSYDSYWTTATAIELVRHGSTRVDALVAQAPKAAAYGLECESKKGPCYNLYPVGTSVVATPLVGLVGAAVAVVGPLAPRTGPVLSHPEVRAFFAGDLLAGRMLTELCCASLIAALAVWVQYLVAAFFVPRGAAVGLALLFAFGTSVWSVASRSLLPHGATLLLLNGALYFFLEARVAPPRLWAAGALLALAFTVRPSNAISCVVLGLYTAVHLRRHLPALLAGALPVGAAYFAYEALVKHAWISRYVREALIPIGFRQGAAMHLFSPSRGLLVYTPIMLVSAAGVWLGWRRGWCMPLLPWLAAIPVLHFALVAGAWPGHGYGPRFFSDSMHLAVFFLIPAIVWWQGTGGGTRQACAAVFLLLAGWGVFTHGHGAISPVPNQWSSVPVDVDVAHWRVWDWQDPQFLRGLR